MPWHVARLLLRCASKASTRASLWRVEASWSTRSPAPTPQAATACTCCAASSRPFKPEDSLAPIAKRLSELLGRAVTLKADWVDGVAVAPGEVVLLENCRVNKGEKKNSDELAQKMAALCDVCLLYTSPSPRD